MPMEDTPSIARSGERDDRSNAPSTSEWDRQVRDGTDSTKKRKTSTTSDARDEKRRHRGRKRPPPLGKCYRYGNYDRYYGYRVGTTMEDARLAALRDEWFRARYACDVGCNDGLFSLSLASAMRPKTLTCVDIDGDLIERAKRRLDGLRMASTAGEAEEDDPFAGVKFIEANAVTHDFGRERFDVILALSLTKWIHLNFGDDGVRSVFARCRDALRPGGSLVLEPQPWKSYKSTLRKKYRGVDVLPNECKERYAAIAFKPDAFESYLLSPEGGLVSCERLRAFGDAARGFDRDLLRFIKNA